MNEIRRNRNRQLFIDAACEIIEHEGIEAATIRNISAKAGYNSGTLYSYFENLSHLILCAHMRFEEEIMELMQAEAAKSEKTYFELWPQMYILMARYYLSHPNAFECSYLYKNEMGKEEEMRIIRKENSTFQKYIIKCLQRIAQEKNRTMEEVLKVSQACISLMVGYVLLAVRKRVGDEEEKVLKDLEESIETIIHTMS